MLRQAVTECLGKEPSSALIDWQILIRLFFLKSAKLELRTLPRLAPVSLMALATGLRYFSRGRSCCFVIALFAGAAQFSGIFS